MGEHTELKVRDSETSALQAPADLRPLANRSMFWRPSYLAPSAWTEHVPFAFWLVEAHRPRVLVELGTHFGTSYFGFCQAVDRLNLDTRCFAVDTWKGDEHSGEYDESVYEQVSAYNDAHYSGFSRLVRSTFDEALQHFTDGTVDLLHIDGLHTLEAVTHDFESWLPKLSRRAIVIFHDINVRERGFGVFKLFEQLSQRYPVFEFAHGHGLGVVAVGPDSGREESLQQLFQANAEPARQRAVREVFSRLGHACADAFRVQEAREAAGETRLVRKSLESTRNELERHRVELAEVQVRLQRVSEKYAAERGEWARQVSREAELTELIRQLQAELAERNEEVAALRKRVEHAGQVEQRLAEAEKIQSQRRREFAALSEQLRKRDAELATLRGQRDQQVASELQALQARLDQREDHLATSGRRVAELEQQLEQSRCEVERLSHSRSWRLTAPLRWVSRPFSGTAPGQREEPDSALFDLLKDSDYFDAAWYRRRYPDVAQSGVDPIRHFLECGASEGRDPSDRFSTRGYLDQYPDVVGSGSNPLVHFLRFGRSEGRTPGVATTDGSAPSETDPEDRD